MSLSVQFLSLLAMIGTGVAAGAFMDMIGTGTAYAGKKSLVRKYAVLLEVIGWVLVGCGTFYVLYLVRDGAWRMYDPVAQVSGLLLYASFFYRPFRLLGRILLILFVKPLWYIVNLLVSIVRQVFRLLVKVLAVPILPFVKLFHRIPRKRFKRKEK